MIAAATIKAIDLVGESADLRKRLTANADRFRSAMELAGFALAGEGHPIVPVMLGDARWSSAMNTSVSLRRLGLKSMDLKSVNEFLAKVMLCVADVGTAKRADATYASTP